MHMRSLVAVALCGALGCDTQPTVAPTLDAAPADARDAAAESAADGGGALATFHGVPVRAWDRTMPEVDAIGYEVDLTVDESSAKAETFRGELRGLFVATAAGDALTLDYTGEAVDGAEVDGRAVTPTRDAGALRIPLGRTVAEGEFFRVTVRYHGALFQGTGADASNLETLGGLMVFQRNRAGRKIYESLNWPSKARRWLPVRDHPRDGAMVAVTATFPARYTVLSNGRMESMRDAAGGARTWSYFCATPMPTYDFHVAAYDDWAETTAMSGRNQRPLRWLPYSGDRAAGMTLFQELPAAMDFFEEAFGPFRWEQAGFIEAPIFGGGMEHATLVTMDESLFRTAARSRQVTFHELAHHWSGNLVRIGTWNDFWLSEGFTDYLTGRFLDAHDGPEAGLRNWRNFFNSALGVERAASHHPLRPAEPEINPLRIFDAITYKKGALVLRTLEHRVGSEAFTTFLRGWFERHAGEAMTTPQFERELAAAFPQDDIAGFFRQLVYGEYLPVLEATTRYDAAARRVSLTLRQTQQRGPEGGFTFPVVVEFVRGDTRERATVRVTGTSTTVDVPLMFEPASVVVDPDERAYLTVTCSDAAPCRDGWSCASAGGVHPAMCMPLRS
jgi:aminopeptidase N